MAKSQPERFVRVAPVTAIIVIGTLILIIGIILNPVFVDILHSEFKKMLPMTNTSSTLATWKDPRDSVDMFMKFYFFDLQNPEEVANGGKPNVSQIGPFTYNEIKIKENVTFDTADSTATFRSPRSFVFNRSMSVGNENTTFTTINVPLVAVVTMLQAYPAMEELLSLALQDLLTDEKPFKRLSVYQLLFGYKDTLMTDAGAILKLLNISLPLPMDGYFGFFYKKNGTDDGLYTVKTGQDGLSKFMEVTEWNHKPLLSYWKTKYCNMINGTDGTMYHPFIDVTDKLFIFSSDLCRSIDLVYDSKHFLQDIPQYRFKPPASLFGYPPDNYGSACYCLGPNGCPHNGVLNISAAQQGAPVFASQPHFLNGPYYQHTVVGMHPNESIHNTYIDVEPTTGIVMQGAKRLQMNMPITRNPYVKEFNHFPTLLYPLLWLEESALINAKGISTFKDMFFNIQQWVTCISYMCIALGAFLIVLTLAYIAVKYRNHRRAAALKVNSDTPTAGERTPLLNGATSPPPAQQPPDDETENDWASMIGNQ